MKKITFLSAILVATMATAQVVEIQQLEQQEVKQIQAVAAKVDGGFVHEYLSSETLGKKMAAAADYAACGYYYCDGMMHVGVEEGLGRYAAAFLCLPYMDSVVWESYYGATDWLHAADGKTVIKEKSETMTTAYGVSSTGAYYVPQIADHTYQQYSIKGYMYGEMNQAQYLFSATADAWPLTLCNMWNNSYMAEKRGGNTADFFMVGNANEKYGPYYYGTHHVVDTITGEIGDTLGILVSNKGTLKIDDIVIPIYNGSNLGIEKMMPEGASFVINIYPADLAKGKIFESEEYLIASTEVTADSWVEGYDPYYGTLTARFQEEDILGGMMDVPVIIDGDFYVQIAGMNASGCDFGIFSDIDCPKAYTTVFQHDGKYDFLKSSGGLNLGVSFHAYWPVIANDTTINTMNAPVEGGYTYYGENVDDIETLLWTNVHDLDSWEFDVPEWLGVGIDTTYLTSNDAVLAAFQAEALPADVEGRTGVVTITADGFTFEMTFNQGKVNTAVDNVFAPLFDNKIYNLLGVEVDENYKGIVIKNGQKYIQ